MCQDFVIVNAQTRFDLWWKTHANKINSPSVLASQEPWEYHYPTVFGIQYVELTQLVRLRDCILAAEDKWSRINNKRLSCESTASADSWLDFFGWHLPESDGSEWQDAVMEVHAPFSSVVMKQLKG